MTVLAEIGRAGIIERQAEAEAALLLDLRDRLEDALRREQIQPAILVVGPKRAPVEALRPLHPERTGRHGL
jgi:hypothetical protein